MLSMAEDAVILQLEIIHKYLVWCTDCNEDNLFNMTFQFQHLSVRINHIL